MDGLAKELMPAPYAQPPRQSVFHTRNQNATGTGRLSTSAPNLQSLPKVLTPTLREA